MGKLGVIIVAAGKGSRMGTAESKQYLQLGQKPILVHTLNYFKTYMKWMKSFSLLVRADVDRCRGYVRTTFFPKSHMC